LIKKQPNSTPDPFYPHRAWHLGTSDWPGATSGLGSLLAPALAIAEESEKTPRWNEALIEAA